MNKPVRVRNTFASAFIAVGLVALWFPDTDPPTQEPDKPFTNDIIYFMEKVSLIETTTDGQAFRWLESEKLVHFSDQHSELLQPVLRQKNLQTGESWQASAHTAQLQNHQTAQLSGNVVVAQPAQGLTLNTEQLNLDLEKQTATSSQDVILKTPKATIHAKGLEADFNSRQLHLMSAVRGHYVTP